MPTFWQNPGMIMKKNEVTIKEALMALVNENKIKQPYNQSRIEQLWLESYGAYN